MKIQDFYGINPPQKPDKPVQPVRNRKVESKDPEKVSAGNAAKSDQVQISPEAQELQKSNDEFGVSKELLAKLPSSRAHVVYEALAKIKAGFYSSDEVAEQAAEKLLGSGELKDLVDF